MKNGQKFIGMFNLDCFVAAAAFFLIARISARTIAAKVETAKVESKEQPFRISGGVRIRMMITLAASFLTI